MNFKIKDSKPLLLSVKFGNYKNQDFSPLIERVLVGVTVLLVAIVVFFCCRLPCTNNVKVNNVPMEYLDLSGNAENQSLSKWVALHT